MKNKASAKKKVKPKNLGNTGAKTAGGMKRFYPVLIAALAFLLYSNTLGHGFVLDDASVISSNRHVMKGTEGISDIWKTSYRDGYWNDSGTLYRPVALTMFAIEWELSDGDPALGHWLNVLFYALLCASLFLLIKRLTQNDEVALFTALLFAAATVHTEVIANIKSRDEIFSMLMGVWAWMMVHKWVQAKGLLSLVLAGVFFTLGMFTKEGLISFVAVIPLSVWYFMKTDTKTLIFSASPLVAATAIYLMARASVLGGLQGSLTPSTIDNPMVKYELADRFFTSMRLLELYIQKLFVPVPLAYEYAFDTIPKADASSIMSWLGLALLLGIIFVAIKGFRSRSVLSFAAFYFLITMVLYSNLFVIIGAMFAERFLFFSSLGWALALGVLAMRIAKPKMRMGAIAGLCFIYGLLTVQRNPVWASDYSLYAADIETLDNSCKAHYNLGIEIMKDKALNASSPEEKRSYLLEAKQEFLRALEIKPSYGLPKGQIALVYYRLGDMKEAIVRYEEALKTSPGDEKAWNNLAAAYVSEQRYEEALQCYENAISINPYYLDALGNMGAINGMLARHEEAIKYLKRAIDINPRVASYYNYMALSYAALGNETEAQKWQQLYQSMTKQ